MCIGLFVENYKMWRKEIKDLSKKVHHDNWLEDNKDVIYPQIDKLSIFLSYIGKIKFVDTVDITQNN